MEELMKKFAHLDEATRKRIRNFVSSKSVLSSRKLEDYKRHLHNLEHQINRLIKGNAQVS